MSYPWKGLVTATDKFDFLQIHQVQHRNDEGTPLAVILRSVSDEESPSMEQGLRLRGTLRFAQSDRKKYQKGTGKKF